MFKQIEAVCQFEHLKLNPYHLVFMHRERNSGRIRSTTVLLVQRNGAVAMAGDGQVTLGETVIKGNARKVRRLLNGEILAGFAGATADAFSLLSRFETKLGEFQGQLERAAIELSKDWRTDKYLRHLEALLIVADKNDAFLISGKGDVISSDEGLLSVGSGSMYALAAARALIKHTELSAREIAEEALRIASEICIYTNSDIIVEEL
jgi:ATP-dependent HslUV protease, peptidase subunit HslV